MMLWAKLCIEWVYRWLDRSLGYSLRLFNPLRKILHSNIFLVNKYGEQVCIIFR